MIEVLINLDKIEGATNVTLEIQKIRSMRIGAETSYYFVGLEGAILDDDRLLFGPMTVFIDKRPVFSSWVHYSPADSVPACPVFRVVDGKPRVWEGPR